MSVKRNQKKQIIIIGIILLIVSGLVVLAVLKYLGSKNSSINDDEKKLPDGTTINNRSDKNNNTSTGPEQGDFTVTITQVSQNETTLTIRAIIDGTSSGDCVLTLKNGSNTISKDTNIGVGPSYYYCNGFVMNKNELSKGQWQLNLEVKSQGKSVNVNQEITVE